MNTNKRLPLLLVFSLLVVGCSVPAKRTDDAVKVGIAVIGVTARSGLELHTSRAVLAQELAERLAERGEFTVLPAASLRSLVRPERLDALLARYAAYPELNHQDRQLLMAAGLPTSRAIVARVEQDFIRHPVRRREAMVSGAGRLLPDRERSILTTQRVTVVSATLFDLANGREIWTRHYQVAPLSESTSTHYLGSSLSGTLAAAVANTMVSGVSVSGYPEAPRLRSGLSFLFREIARNIPAS